MSIKLFPLSILLVLSLLLSSCIVTKYNYYAPDESNMLKLVDKNDIKISGSIGNSIISQVNSYANFQVGYSPIKHVGIFGNHFRFSEKEIDFVLGERIVESFGKLNYNSAGIGGYYLWQSKKQKLRSDSLNVLPAGILFDSYLGYGRGNIYSQYSISDAHFTDLNFDKKFIQFGLHWQDEIIGISYVFKVGKINYFEGLVNGQVPTEALGSLNGIIDVRDFPFRETSVKGYIGTKEARFYIGITSTVINPDDVFTHKKSYVSLGLVLNVDDIFYSIKNKRKMKF